MSEAKTAREWVQMLVPYLGHKRDCAAYRGRDCSCGFVELQSKLTRLLTGHD